MSEPDKDYTLRQLRGAFSAGRNGTSGDSKEKPRKVGGLRGLFFTCDARGWQGIVVEDLPGEWLLVQLFEWLVGGPSDGKLIHFSVAADFDFYFDEEDWQHGGRAMLARLDATRQREAESIDAEPQA